MRVLSLNQLQVNMVQPKRNQPPRVCKNPQHVYHKPEPEEEIKEEPVVRPKKRKQNLGQGELRAIVATSPKLDNTLWNGLGDDMVDAILSRLPVYKLWDTVMAVNPTRWKQIFSNNGNAYIDGILGHGNHVDSSIGYIKTYKNSWGPCRSIPCPPPCVLEHNTQTWKSLPKHPELDVCPSLQVRGGSDGLLLIVQPLFTPLRSFNNSQRIVVWNPMLQAHRMLPQSPLSYDWHDYPRCVDVLAVDQDRKGYKVMEFVPTLVKDPATGTHQKIFTCYVVYNSVFGNWGVIQPTPPNMLELCLNYKKTCVSCEGCVCFVTVERQSWDVKLRGLVCYNLTTDVWSEVLFPPIFFDELGTGSWPAISIVKALLYASGKVYVIFNHRLKNSSFVDVASIALVDIQSGVAAFDLVARVRESKYARIDYPDVKHPAPKCPRSSPRSRRSDLILKCRCLLNKDSHHWYILSVGSTFYLCTELCGRWHRRFNLVAGEWTDFRMQVPSDAHAETMGRWEPSYFPYVPSWVKV